MVAAPSEIREIPEGSVGGKWRRIGTRASHCPACTAVPVP